MNFKYPGLLIVFNDLNSLANTSYWTNTSIKAIEKSIISKQINYNN